MIRVIACIYILSCSSYVVAYSVSLSLLLCATVHTPLALETPRKFARVNVEVLLARVSVFSPGAASIYTLERSWRERKGMR